MTERERHDGAWHCITCADEGRAGRVVALHAASMASVELDGRIEEVALDLLDGVAPGDHVLVHAGVALVRLDR